MGKKYKHRQMTSQSSHSDSEENGNTSQVPVEFLTSDDFKVVQKKGHHKRYPDTHEDSDHPRSRHNSCKISVSSDTDQGESVGCYSSFWSYRYENNESDVLDAGDKCLSSHGKEDLCGIESSSYDNNDFDVKVKKAISEPELDLHSKLQNDCDSCLDCLNKIASLSLTSDLRCNGDSGNIAQNENFQQNIILPEKKLFKFNTSEHGGGDGESREKQATAQCLTETVINNGYEKPQSGLSLEENDHSNACTVKDKTQKKKKQKHKKCDHSETSEDKMLSLQPDVPLSSNMSPSDCPIISLPHVEDVEHKKEHDKHQDRKKPSKKQLAAIHEALKKAKETAEKRLREEETKKKIAEEAERLRQEQLRLDQEKKEKKKQKEKLKRERLKAEGRLLSKSQKQARARMQATLEIYRQQGIDIPQIGEHRPRLGSYVCTHRKRFDSSHSDQGMCTKSERHKSESLSSQESKESFSDLPSSFDSKDSFDLVTAGSLPALAHESDPGFISGMEDSGVLNDDHHSLSKSVPSSLTNSIEKVDFAKMIKNLEPKDNNPKMKLRSPVVCVLGHVDTGKTKLLDFIRKTHVQDSEAGGITQQIGATMIPQSALKEKCKMVKGFVPHELKVPGLLVIDTPGHESFRNLRSRGTSLCDIAILVVDIMHGLEAQTLESIHLLRKNKVPFVVALNKVDRIYGWKNIKDADIVNVISQQSESTLWEFKKRCQELVLQFANECLNAALFYENKDPKSFVSMVPTSAITGEGMGNILHLIVHLTQSHMHKHLLFANELKATVLEVKVIPGLGTTIDVILVNGQLHEGDTIVLAGQDGPIVTQIRSLLMPQPLKELRVKNPYIDYKTVEGAQGVKISGKDLDKALAGMPLFVAENSSKIETWKTKVSRLVCLSSNNIRISERGVYVQASTLGSLEALLDYLSSEGIPYFGTKVGPVVKKDVMKASCMLEHDSQYAAILAFDVKVEKDAQELADHLGVKILHADIIYHLLDMYLQHRDDHRKMLEEKKHLAIFPCILTLLGITASEYPLVLHVTVEAGTLKEGTPLCIPKKNNLDVGCVTAIQVDGVSVSSAKEGDCAIITLENDLYKPVQLEQDDNLVSRISRQSIEICKEYFKSELSPSDWHLISELKKLLRNI